MRNTTSLHNLTLFDQGVKHAICQAFPADDFMVKKPKMMKYNVSLNVHFYRYLVIFIIIYLLLKEKFVNPNGLWSFLRYEGSALMN